MSPAVNLLKKHSKQGTAIEATRNFLGQASDGLVRNEEFFWTGKASALVFEVELDAPSLSFILPLS